MSGSEGCILASSADVIKLWKIGAGPDAQKASLVQQLAPHTKTINCIRWNHNNQVLAAASDDGTIALSHMSGTMLWRLPVHATENMEKINSLSFSSGSRYLCSGGTHAAVKIWDLKKRENIKAFMGHTDAITCVSWSANEKHIASGSLSGDILLHSCDTQQAVGSFRAPNTQAIKSLQFSPFRKNLFAASSDDGSVYVWDITKRDFHASFPLQHGAPCVSVCFSPVNQLLLASAGLDKRVCFFDIKDSKVVKNLNVDAPLSAMTFAEDGVGIAVGTSHGKIMLYDLRAGAVPLSVFEAHNGPVTCLQFQCHKKEATTTSKPSSMSAQLPSNRSHPTGDSTSPSSGVDTMNTSSKSQLQQPQQGDSRKTPVTSMLMKDESFYKSSFHFDNNNTSGGRLSISHDVSRNQGANAYNSLRLSDDVENALRKQSATTTNGSFHPQQTTPLQTQQQPQSDAGMSLFSPVKEVKSTTTKTANGYLPTVEELRSQATTGGSMNMQQTPTMSIASGSKKNSFTEIQQQQQTPAQRTYNSTPTVVEQKPTTKATSAASNNNFNLFSPLASAATSHHNNRESLSPPRTTTGAPLFGSSSSSSAPSIGDFTPLNFQQQRPSASITTTPTTGFFNNLGQTAPAPMTSTSTGRTPSPYVALRDQTTTEIPLPTTTSATRSKSTERLHPQPQPHPQYQPQPQPHTSPGGRRYKKDVRSSQGSSENDADNEDYNPDEDEEMVDAAHHHRNRVNRQHQQPPTVSTMRQQQQQLQPQLQPRYSNSPPKRDSPSSHSSSRQQEADHRLLTRSNNNNNNDDVVVPVLPDGSTSNNNSNSNNNNNDFYTRFIQNTLEESLSGFRSAIQQDIRNLHLDLLRQFHIQQTETTAQIERLVAQIKPLTEEIQLLREENRRLKHFMFR